MDRIKHYIRNMVIMAAILLGSFLVSLLLQEYFNVTAAIPMVFVFAVFLVALLTHAYIYGIAAAIISVLAVNYAFTFPFFALNFTIPENFISAVIMIGVAIFTSALTIRLRKQEMLRAEGEKERMRANLLRAISHDLRTPLTTIYGSSSALLENQDSFTPSQQAQMLRSIREDSQWLVGMVENLLSVTRIDSGRVKLIKTPTALDELVDAALLKFKKRYPGQGVELELPEELVMIPMDPMLIQQVLMNLLENAVLHATGMTSLILKITVHGNKATFFVLDDGCGIPREKLPAIFSGESGNGETSPDSKKRNAGIGLSVCATIIKAHGGTISAENRKSGGAVFYFTLDTEEAI